MFKKVRVTCPYCFGIGEKTKNKDKKAFEFKCTTCKKTFWINKDCLK